MAERPLYTLYKNLKAQNYDVPDDYNKFESALTRDGKGGADNRHAIYENLKAQNFDVPSTYERFYSALFEPRSKTSSRAKGGSVPMTAADRARFSAGAAAISASAQQAMNNAGRYNRLKQRKQKQQKDFGRVNLGTHQTPYGGDANNVVKDDFAYNPETGKAGAYVTSDNENAYTQNDAEQKQILLDKYGEEWNNAVDMGIVPSELDKADPDLSDTDVAMRQMERRQEWLNENQDRRSKELNESMHLQGSPFVASGGAVAPSSFNTAISNEANRLSDVEYGAYNTAKAYNQMLRTTLLQELKEQKQRNENAGWLKDKWNDVSNYFGAMFNTMLDPKLYSQGIMDAAISNNLLQVKKGMEDGTIKKGSNAGNAAQAMLGAIQQQQGEAAKQQQYGTKAYQYGDMSGRSLKFMADFASSGWRNVMTTGFTKAGEKVGEKMALGALGKWFTKNTGRVLGDIAGSAALAATNQLGSTYNNVIERYVGMNNENGGVTQDKNGDLKFNEGVSLGKAIKDGFGSATIENFSEMFGEYLPGAPKLLSKLGLSKVSSFFEKIGNNAYYKWLSNATNKSGIQGVLAEISEEEFGTALHAAWGDGDGSWSDFNVFTNPDAREKQIDTCLGMFYSVGFMQAPRTAVGAINAVQYFNIKHQVAKADKFGQVMFNDKWEEIKSKIDVTTNADLTKTVLDATRSDSMTAKQKGAVINYAMFLSKLRGFNQAADAKTKDKVEEGDTAPTLSNNLDDAYTEGHNADDADKHDIQLEQNDKANELAAMLHITPEQLHDMADEDLEAMTGQDDKLDQAIYDYQVSTAKYQGVMDGAQDEVDMAAHQAAMETDNMTDLNRGTVRKATIKATGGLEDYEVYIISGNIATHDDGYIDIGDSDDMIIYYDPTTGRKEHADAMMFADLIEELPAADVKAQAIIDAKENAIKKIAGIIDGTVEVGSQFSVTDADGTEHTYEVLADNGDGTAMITIDGNVPTELVKGENVQIPYSFADLQQMKDMEDQKRLEAAKAQREQMEKERAAQQTQENQPSFDFNQILNDNGNVVLADVLGKDGNTKYPNSQLFLIRDSGAKAKVMELKSDGTLVPHAVNKKDVRTATTMTLDEYKQAFAGSSMIEDNSGTIEADRGGIEVGDNTQPLSEADADNIIAQMESSAEVAPELELTPDNWAAEFGEDGIVSTPIGDVKMGENQVAKLFEKGRSKEFGMIKPTLTNPDVIIEVPSHSADDNEERSSSYLFIKTFLGKNGKKVYYFKSVTIKKDGLEISISSHYDRAKRVKEALMKGKLLYRKNDGAQTEQNQPSTSVTTSQEDAAGSSKSKDTNISANSNENNESLTFEDGTPIPVDESGETDLSQTDAAHAAEWYDNNLGEDADDWLDGEIKKAKKVLEQAKNRKLTGTKPSELVASKKEKEAAIADAQAHYDSAISIRDALKERQLAKVEDTAEGRKELIEKARRKFARLKSAVKDDAEAVAQLYKETVGTLLHRLYDGTGIDVTDTIPLTAEEYVASNLGAHTLNYEGTETSKGVKQETGLSREDFAKTQLLAADGKGTTIDNLVHSLWENRPSNLESLGTQEIRNAMLSVITSGFKASEARNYIENLRIAQAENFLEEQKKAADNAAFAEENKAEAEQQTETAPESEEKTGEENSDEINDEENEKINEQTNENINAPEVPEDATAENPLGAQLDQTELPFSARDNGTQQTTTERASDVEKNKVDDVKVVDNIVGKKTRKTLEKIAKMMGANVQWQYSDKNANGWFDDKTNTIYLTLDSSITEGVQFIFGHEMTHEMRTKNPAAYEELKTLVKDMMGEDAFNKETDRITSLYNENNVFYNGGRTAYDEEVVADQLGKWIRDANYAHTLLLKMSHPLLARLHEIVNRFLMALHGIEISDDMNLILRSIEQAYVKTAKGEVTNTETGEDVSFSLRQKPEPQKKGIGYKVFVLKDGKLYPPMVANPDGAATPVGVWLDADAAPIAGESKTGRPQVKQGGKGTQGGSGKLAYRPGWHLGVVPYAIQFNRKDADGNKTLFPKNFVFAEVEYAADVDYQEEARQEGINPSGKYQHSLAGLKHLPTDGYYMYRTNPNPETDPWVITGAMKVNRILTRAEQAELVKKAGREPQQIQEGDIVTDDVVNSINQEIAAAPKFSLKSKPVRFEAGKKLSDEEKKEVLSTLKDAYKVNGVPYHIEETAGGKEKRVYEPTADSYVVSDITNRPLRYYITLPDGRVAHPTEVYPNISDNEVKSSATKQGLLDDEVDQIVRTAIGNMKDIADNAKAVEVLTELQNLPHETHDVGYGLNHARSYNYKTGIFTSDAAQAIDYVVRRMRRKEDVPAEIPAALKKAVADSYGMVDNLIDGMSNTKVGAAEIKPVSVGVFGNVYNQFRGKAKAAIEFLKKLGSGEATAALHHHTIGDISLVWGDKKTGLDKILRKHPEVVDNLQSIIDSMEVVQESDNRIKLESPTHFAVVSKEYKGEPREQWLLTAYEKRESLENGKSMDTATSSLGGDTALSQSKESAAKIDNSSETAKENGEKFSLKDEKIKSVAEKFGVNEDDVAMYANAVERGSTAEAARARANIKRYLLQVNEGNIFSFKDIVKYTKPINEALKENFGDLDAMIEERRKQVEAERNAMEAARKRAQEEEEKRQKHLEELSLIPTDELDKRYMDAIDNNDESTAREMLDESARRKGYDDADSDYQGQGAWAAPSNPQYESDKERRADIDNAPDVNLEDIALGYSLQPDDYFSHPERYSQNTPHGLESVKAINTAIDAIKNGEKDVKVKVYRAVPTSVKEGKLRNGDWVTPSKKYAEMHGDHRLEGKYRIIEDEVPANQLWWDGNDANEFGFDDGKEYRYKNAKNNRKLNDLITYDNKGNVIPPSKRFNSRKNDIRFSLAGERAAAAADKAEERTIRMDNLSVAKDMEKNKKKAKAIKAATGWERGADGKWRYEMPDVVLRDPKEWVNKKTLTLSDIVEKPNDLFKEYPELFDAYPELKDMKILKGRAKSGGVFYNNAITLNLGDIREAIKYDLDTHYKLANNSLKKTLVHEIQHYIQEKEGFAQGGNSEMIIDKNALDAIAKLRAEKDAVAKEFYAMSPEEQQRRKYEINNRYNDLTKQIERLEKSSRIGYDGYKRLSGEVEARNVSARLNMTPEERRKSLAESTEDVARKDQIFLGVGDVSFSLRDMADGKDSGAADMAEDLKSLNTPDEVDDAIRTAIEDMPIGWKMANMKMIHVAQALGENRKAEIAGEEPKFSLKDGSLIKAGTYFSGGGLVEEGLKGIIDPVVAVEYDEKISGVYRNNFGQHIVTADVRDVDPKELVKQIDGEVEYFHASPVCKNYSQAKSSHAEVELDKETAASTAEFINAVKPKVVTIENVKGYKDSDAMKTITDALDANGYTWDADVYNAADYGGYTNRERLIVRAVRDGKLPAKPKKMAHKSGWYEAVADIIPTLTEKKNGVAPWMDVRLKADGIDWRNIDKPLYVMGSAYADGKVPHAFADELLPTLRTKSGDVIVMPDGKVYRAMGRVLARVTGVSDDYKMPFSENLSHTIIGNGIPTQLTEHVIAPLLTGSAPKFSIRTYHGTGASFDKFDLSHALEGEGSETFGHGVYVTNSSKIGREYAQRAKQRKMADLYKNMRYPDGVKGDIFKRRVFGEMVNDVATGGSVASAKEFAKKRIGADANDIQRTLENLKDREKGTEYEQNLKDRLAEYKEGLKWIDSLDEDYLTQGNANRYDVDIPDDNGSNYLDWENPMSEEQINAIRDALAKKGVDVPSWEKRGFKLDLPFKDVYAAVLPMMMRYKPEDVSKFLSSLGFTGIKYPAGMVYGGAEKGDYNYVIFDENNANIVGNTRFSLRYDQFEHDLNQWKKDNNLPKDAQRPTIPQRNAGESAVDFLRRVDEYRKQMALWKTAPTYEQHLLSDDTALGEFNRELQRGSVLKRIAFQDSMLAIRKAQEAIMKEVGVDRLNMAEDAYTAENRSHGKGKNEFEEYNNEFLQPLRKAYHQMKKILGDSYDNVRIYMMAKHGLERDAQMAFKKSLDADFEDVAQRSAAYRAYKGDMNRITNDSDLEFGRVDFNTWRQRDNALRTKYSPSYMDYRYDENGIAYDYSGLSALFGGSDFEEAAHKLVRDIESSHVAEVQDLWNATNAATKKILRDGYKAGMMSKDTYQYVRDMYSHYIPLRGWDGTTADQVWDYIGGDKGAFNQTLKTAHGRTSIANDPIAYIENMAESGILLNNKNWVKQHLMLLAQNHPTSLLTLSKAWYVKSTDANGNEEWIPATPQITSQMNSNQVKAAIDAFEKKMEQMAQTGDATQKRDGLNIAYPQTHSEEREHEVRVMKDGEEYVIYVNGDPQLAQAMNNTRAHRVREIQSGKLDRAAAWLGRKMAAAYTSLSPLFIPSNYFRDLTMTLASTAIREDAKYNYLLRKNLATSWNLGFMLRDYQNGKLREKVSNGNATPKEQMFYDFMMNGGETGFVSSLDVEDLKKKFKNDLKDLDRWKTNPVKVGHTIMDGIEFLNRAIEDSNRFAVYMTSIQYGRSIDEAVNDAKDVTLNFNRKGTGEYGWQMVRNLYLFINPAVQSLQTLGALAKHHPFKFTAVTASWLASGVLVPIVNAALMSLLGGDDDKDKYWQFTKWDRRNNLIMWVPFTHEYVKIPLAQEFRAFYGIGDMIASKMMGGELAEESWSQYAEDMLGQVVDMLPLDPTGYDGNIAVSLMPNAIRPVFELAFNVDFTGKPLFKDSEYNKYDPNFTKAYVGTPDWLVRASRMINSIGNDYPDVQQNSIDAFGDPRYNLNNPAVVDHVLSSYLGGAYTMGSQVLGVLTKALNDPKEIKMADIPLFSKFVSNPDDRPITKKQGDEFWDMKENHDRAANTLSKLKKQAKVDGDYSMLERFYGSEEYKQYKQDDVKVKKYEEDKKKERAEESGEEYRPHKLNTEDIYKAHATPKDDFEDLKLKQLYTKLNGFKTSYDLLVDTAPSQSDGYYNTNKAAIDAIDEIALDKQEISELKKGFLDDGKDAYNAEDMNQIRELRKKILAVLEKANKVVVANQKAKTVK